MFKGSLILVKTEHRIQLPLIFSVSNVPEKGVVLSFEHAFKNNTRIKNKTIFISSIHHNPRPDYN